VETPSIGSADKPMAVMKVGIMGVCMNQRFMPVNVAMGLAVRVLGSMAMLVMCVMNMIVRVLKRIVLVLVGVPLGEV
jgi:hypothetical protein